MHTTRNVGQAMQQGVRQAKMWRWGPFEVQAVELPYGRTWSIALWIGGYGACASVNRHYGDKSE